jgi:hypothetical protein
MMPTPWRSPYSLLPVKQIGSHGQSTCTSNVYVYEHAHVHAYACVRMRMCMCMCGRVYMCM